MFLYDQMKLLLIVLCVVKARTVRNIEREREEGRMPRYLNSDL